MWLAESLCTLFEVVMLLSMIIFEACLAFMKVWILQWLAWLKFGKIACYVLDLGCVMHNRQLAYQELPLGMPHIGPKGPKVIRTCGP